MARRVGQRLIAAVMLLSAAASLHATTSEPVEAAIDTTAFEPIGPVRLADTRQPSCGCATVDASTIRVAVAGRSDIPADATAAAITITAAPTAQGGFVTAYPSGQDRPESSTLNTRTDRFVANSAIIALGDDGSISLFRLVPGDVIIDVTGVFTPASAARAGRLVAMSATRLVDTREAAHGAAPLGRNGDLTVPLPAGVSSDATAVVVNVTTVHEPSPGFLSARPAGTPATTTSFMNPNGSGQPTAASVILPASSGGVTIRTLSGGHIIVDVTGWFTGPSAPESTVGLFRPQAPTRLLDTRATPPRLHGAGTIELPVPIDGVSSIVTNVTVTDPDRQGFVTAFAAGTDRPSTSALNPAFWNHTVANLAITQVSSRGLAYWSLGGTELIVDVTGSFTGSPVAAPVSPRANAPTHSRALLVGDSTLAGVNAYPSSKDALRGFEAIVDAESCRRLLRPSCRSSDTGLFPNTAVEAILSTPGALDYVVVKGGYNDWFSDFPTEFDAVVQASRAKGAHTIIWLNQNEGVSRPTARRAYEENNADLRWLSQLPQYSDVVFADWLGYSGARRDWFWDGTHVTPAGAYAITDYVARWIAAREHRPCPRAWAVGAAAADPCPPPDATGPVPDPVAVNL